MPRAVRGSSPGGGTVRAVADWLFRSRRTGRWTIVQVPNLPLLVFLAAASVRLVLPDDEGDLDAACSLVGRLALAWWSVDEVVRGESPFRRALGGGVLAGLAARLAWS